MKALISDIQREARRRKTPYIIFAFYLLFFAFAAYGYSVENSETSILSAPQMLFSIALTFAFFAAFTLPTSYIPGLFERYNMELILIRPIWRDKVILGILTGEALLVFKVFVLFSMPVTVFIVIEGSFQALPFLLTFLYAAVALSSLSCLAAFFSIYLGAGPSVFLGLIFMISGLTAGVWEKLAIMISGPLQSLFAFMSWISPPLSQLSSAINDAWSGFYFSPNLLRGLAYILIVVALSIAVFRRRVE